MKSLTEEIAQNDYDLIMELSEVSPEIFTLLSLLVACPLSETQQLNPPLLIEIRLLFSR